jgi:L,D-transpeptidase YcbB
MFPATPAGTKETPCISLLVLVLTILWGQSSAAAAPGQTSPLRDLAASGNLSDLQWPDFVDLRSQIQSFYEPSDYAFAWSRGGAATAPAISIIGLLEEADATGLNAEDYDGSRWAERLTVLRSAGSQPLPEEALARFDLALTVSVMRYISDLHFGRANPGLFHIGFDLDDGGDGLAGFLLRHVVDATDAKSVLEAIEPPYDGYRRVKAALQRYMQLAREEPFVPLPAAKKPVEPGSPYEAASQLADLLRRLGDLPPDVTFPVSASKYEGSLVDAVKRFQTRHGLDSDGRLGNATLAQLNTPLRVRVRQLQLTLERWRWVPRSFPHPPVVVNIPEFRLRALNASYATELEMKVIVGKAYHHKTPVFAAEMRDVVFRPFWNVPVSIQRAELVPEIERDRSYLLKNHYQVVTPQDVVITNGAVDDGVLADLRSGRARIRQTPGPKNALGLVKFLFPNDYDVYLHATPATELFATSRRDFSHGCIRVEKPEELAKWALRGELNWTPEHIHDAMYGSATFQVTLREPIPVVIVYATAVVLDNGEVHFFDDIYGEDIRIETLLAKGPAQE